MIFYKTDEEIEKIRQSCLLVSKTLALAASMLKVGATGKELDRRAEEFIRDHGAVPGFKGYNGFPFTLCISPNEAVVHGFPSDRPFEDGEIVSIDCGVKMDGFYGDAAYTFAIGNVPEEVLNLCKVTHTSLYRAIENAVVGNRLGDVSFAVQDFVQREHPYAVVRELVGHGLGRSLHEAPEVPNFGKRGKGIKLQPGLVIAIEPMVNLGRKDVATLDDGWTVVSRDRKPSAHYEHTIAVTMDGPAILSDHSFLEAEIVKNPDLVEIGVVDLVRN